MNSAYSAWEPNVNYVTNGGGLGPNPFGPTEGGAWGIDHDFCFNPRCDRFSQGSEQNYALAGFQTQNGFGGNTGVFSGEAKGTYTMAWANVYLGDRQAPRLTGTLPGNRDWRDDPTGSVTVSASDAGLGVYQTALEARPGTTGAGIKQQDCLGSPYFRPCSGQASAAHNYTLPEGETQLTISALDVVGNPSNAHRWTEKIDRSNPEILSVSGPLFDKRERAAGDDQRNAGLSGDTHALSVRAQDGLSGVASIQVTAIDESGQRIALASSSSGTFDAPVSITGLNDGAFTIEVTATDRVASPAERHSATQSFPVVIDRVGSVQRAAEYEMASDGSRSKTADEWVDVNGTLGRREDVPDASVATRTAACGVSCGEARLLTATDDDQREVLSIVRSDRSDDSGIPWAARTLEEAVESASGTPAATGPLSEALLLWQRPPAGRGTTFSRYDRVVEADELNDDGSQTSADETTAIWFDSATKLPLRRLVRREGETTTDVRYSYGDSRQTADAYPKSFFAVESSSAERSESTVQAARPEPALESGPESREATIADGQRFRREFGLNDSVATVSAALDAPEISNSIGRFGVALSSSEILEVERQLRLTDTISELDQYIDSRTDMVEHYAGTSIDRDGTVTVRLTDGRADSWRSALTDVFDFPSALRVESADFTLKRIDEVVDALSDRLSSIDGAHQVYADDVNNRVVLVSVDGLSDQTESGLRSEFGNILDYQTGAVATLDALDARRFSITHPPLRGGMGMRSLATGFECSLGFAVRRGDQFRILTAGHCGSVRTIWERRVQAGDSTKPRTVGQTTGRFFGGNTDTATITATGSGLRPAVINRSNRPRVQLQQIRQVARLTSGRVRDATHPGTFLCQSGARKGFPRCGRLISRKATEEFNFGGGKTTLRDQMIASYPELAGDSGGPVYSRSTAWGTVVGRTDRGQVFTPAESIERRFGVRILVK